MNCIKCESDDCRDLRMGNFPANHCCFCAKPQMGSGSGAWSRWACDECKKYDVFIGIGHAVDRMEQ